MANPYALGFVGVAVVALIGVDYTMQAQNAGQIAGQYALSDYIGTYAERFAETRDEWDKSARQAEPARVHLPEAPEGWERRAWAPGSADAALAEVQGLVAQAAVKKAYKQARKAAKDQVWEYVRGSETIRLSAQFDAMEEGKTRAEPVAAFVDIGLVPHDGFYEPYGVVGGVPYFHVLSEDGAQGAIQLQAYLGQDIAIGVHATARPETVRALLERIDYDGLNRMLNAPLAGIGRDAPALTPDQEIEAAQAALDAMGQAGLAEARPEPVAKAASKQTASMADKVKRFFSFEKTADAGQKAMPGRLKLSGGSSCLEGSTGGLCN